MDEPIPATATHCVWCKRKLAEDERLYYGSSCNRCEGELMMAFDEDEPPAPACPWDNWQSIRDLA